MGMPWAVRRLKLRPPYVHVAETVTVLHAHPDLRPTDQCSPREHGLPLGPVLLLTVTTVVAASVIE
ncbi:hypothetical protein BEK98_46440 [Streptomyces diastatochromogenes]|uniref:Uncharacterized protein n=1 Tax=Streptomyces diastatochromogenes TaxID=42236 RepID=A0A233RLW2_STRDA|nr:hypothetical protein BEK98_46440 [Streptomyces diastatochromogenes]